jgi:hypothetical protein
MDRLSDWATIDKLGTIADVLFKLTALVVALAAANFFFYRAEVELDTRVQAFIDISAVRASYAAEDRPVPVLLAEVAEEYNRRNRADLRMGGHNSTRRELPGAELCRRMAGLVEDVFPKADCSQSVVELGRGRYYERLLLARGANQRPPLRAPRLRDALKRLASAEYLKARCSAENVGNAKATDVRIRPSEGFVRPGEQANDPFPLPPKDRFDVEFESARGGHEEDPQIQFGVDWERAGLGGSALAVWVATALLAVFVLVLANDFARSSKSKR